TGSLRSRWIRVSGPERRPALPVGKRRQVGGVGDRRAERGRPPMRSDEGGRGDIAADARVAQLGQGPALDLADALAGEVEVLPHLRQGAGLALVEAEAQIEDPALPPVEGLGTLRDSLTRDR